MSKQFSFYSTLALAAVAMLMTATFANAAGPAGGDYGFSDAYVRETPMKVSAGYVRISNPSGTSDTLVGAQADWAGRIELHHVEADKDGTMMMKQIKEMPLPAHGVLELVPGGYHLMLFDLKEPLKLGETRSITLSFSSGKSATVPFAVQAITYQGQRADNAGMTAAHDHEAHHDHGAHQ